MIVEIPEFALQAKSDNIRLWLAFMLRQSEGEFIKTRYYFQTSDMRHFLKKWVQMTEDVTVGIEQHIRLGKMNGNVWSLDWLSEPNIIRYEITDPDLILIWGYVLGRLATQKGVEDWNGTGIPETENRVQPRADRHWFRYFGSDRFRSAEEPSSIRDTWSKTKP